MMKTLVCVTMLMMTASIVCASDGVLEINSMIKVNGDGNSVLALDTPTTKQHLIGKGALMSQTNVITRQGNTSVSARAAFKSNEEKNGSYSLSKIDKETNRVSLNEDVEFGNSYRFSTVDPESGLRHTVNTVGLKEIGVVSSSYVGSEGFKSTQEMTATGAITESVTAAKGTSRTSEWNYIEGSNVNLYGDVEYSRPKPDDWLAFCSEAERMLDSIGKEKDNATKVGLDNSSPT